MTDDIDWIVEKDGRFKKEAYLFVLDALEFTVQRLRREGHVTGVELLYGIRDLALERFGLMAGDVLEHWGVRTTDDFGAIVFRLVEADRLGRRPEDTAEEFHAVFDLKAELERRHDWFR